MELVVLTQSEQMDEDGIFAVRRKRNSQELAGKN
jgi:hypothetical protein